MSNLRFLKMPLDKMSSKDLEKLLVEIYKIVNERKDSKLYKQFEDLV